MQPHPVANRRAFLALALGLCGISGRAAACGNADVGTKLAAALGLDARAVSVWFAGVPERAAAWRQLALDLEFMATLDIAGLRSYLSERIRSDYLAGRIVAADGWRLAATEAAALGAIYGAAGAQPAPAR